MLSSDAANFVPGIEFYASVCMVVFVGVILLLRRDRNSLGMPVAYLSLLLLIHLPGALVQVVAANVSFDTATIVSPAIYTEIGLQFVAAGTICFAIGLMVARLAIPGPVIGAVAVQPRFWTFCLLGGWFVTFVLVAPFHGVASIGAAMHEAGGIWMLGLMPALASRFEYGDWKKLLPWLGALAIFPIFVLVNGGFLSFGARATIIVLAILTVTTKRLWRLLVVVPVVIVIGLTLFVSYMQHRSELRSAVWHGASLSARIDAAASIFQDFGALSFSNPLVLYAIDARLNQNYFVGLAADRIWHHQTRYLYGQTIEDAAIALIPRMLWPSKPVAAGSGNIVLDATGLNLNAQTSWGVGNVMEFEINYGWPGIIVGFLLLGLTIGTLDRKAAIAYAKGDLSGAILFFLPCTALIDAQGSMVEVTTGAASALVAAFGWRWLWQQWDGQRRLKASPIPVQAQRDTPS